MLFPPAPRNDLRFVSLFFIGNGGWREKHKKGRFERIFQQKFCDYLGTCSHKTFMAPYTTTTSFHPSAKSELLQHVADHRVEGSCVRRCPDSTEGEWTSPDTRAAAVTSPSVPLPLTHCLAGGQYLKQRWEEQTGERGVLTTHHSNTRPRLLWLTCSTL